MSRTIYDSPAYAQCRKDRETQARIISELQKHIATLARREALLTAFACAFCAVWNEARFPSESPLEEHIQKLDELKVAAYRHFEALEAAGFTGSGWQDLVRAQVEVNTAGEQEREMISSEYEIARQDGIRMSRIVTEQGQRIAELEAENTALREFVALVDAYEATKGATKLWCDYTGGGTRYEALKRARQRLASEYGLPVGEVVR